MITNNTRLFFYCVLMALLPVLCNSQNNWAWMQGSSTNMSVVPVHGTQGIATSSNTPGSRWCSVSFTDNNGNLWLFGGYDVAYGFGSDLWRYNISTNQWTWVKGPSTANQAGLYGTKGVASSTTNPGSRYLSTGWADNNGNLWLFGGYGYGTSSWGYLNDLWRYNISTGQWTWMSGSSTPDQAGTYGTMGTGSGTNTPGSRYSQHGIKDNSGNLWLFGGIGYAAGTTTVGDLNDLWKYNISAGTWTWMKGSNALDQYGVYGTQGVASSSNTPGSRRAGTEWSDNSGNLWIFGGYGFAASSQGLMNDLWKYDVTTGNWTWMKGANAPTQFGWYGTQGQPAANNVPGARYYAPVGVRDIAGNFWLFGGFAYSSSSGGPVNDLWKYDISTNMWTWMHGSASPNQYGTSGTQGSGASANTPGSRYMHVAWGDNSGHYWTYGGYGYPSSSATTTNSAGLSDLWKYDICLFPVEPVNVTPAQSMTLCSGGNSTLSAVSGSSVVRWYATSTSTNVIATGTTFVTPTLTTNGSLSIVTYFAESFSCAPSASRTAISLTVYPNPTITVNSGTACAGGVFVMLPSGALNYTFSGGSQVVFPSVNSTYTVTGTSAQGCAAVSPAYANVTVMPLPSISVNSGSVCSGAQFVMTPAGAATYTYSSGSATVSPTSSTFYVVMGTSSLGCVSQFPAVSNVVVLSSPTVTVNSGAICSGGSFTLVPSGASAYTISGGTAVVTPSATTMYTVWGSNAANCISSAVATVVVNPIPAITVNSGAICSGGSFTLSPSGAATYTFSGGSQVVSPSSTTSYTVTGTSSAGCVAAAAAVATVAVNPLPVIGVNSGTVCAGSSFTLIPTGAATYTYSSGSPVVSPSVNSIYFVTGSSAAGCVAASPAIANVSVVPGSPITVNSGSICQGQTFTISPSGAATYSISGGSFVVSPPVTTTYQVTGTNAAGCVSGPAGATVVVSPAPAVSVSSGSICIGKSFTMVPSGAVSYTFSSGSPVVSPTANTTYTVIGSSGAGCLSAPAIAGVTVHVLPIVSVNSGSICAGSAFTMIPSGAVTYTFSSGSAIVSPTSNATYSVFGTSSQGCVSSSAAITSVSVVNSPVVTVNSGTICRGGSFTLVPSGATSYTFSSGSAVVSPTTNTNYTVTGSASSGCTSSPAIASITVFALPLITINSGSICQGGSFTLVPGGGISYSFVPGGPVVTPTFNTTYSVIGTNSQGCVSSGPALANVTVHTLPVISVASGSVCSGASFTLVPSGASSYTYSSGTAIVTPSSTTSYSVWGTSAQGCSANIPATSTISVVNLPVVSVNSGTICRGNSFTLVPSGAATYTFSSGSSVVSPSVTTTYSVTGSNTSGCVVASAAVATVVVNNTFVISVGSGSMCAGQSFTMSPSGASTYTYSGGSSVVSPTANSVYTVTGTSAAGCISQPATASVTVVPRPVVTVNSGSVCAGAAFTIIPSGAITYTYSGGSQVVFPTVNSTYTVVGSSSSGCISLPVLSSVVVNTLPVITVSGGGVCPGGTFTLNPTGAVSFTYSSGSPVVSPTAATSYSVYGTSAQGCISQIPAVATITLHTIPVITVNGGSVCAGSSITLSSTGALTYTYSPGGPVVNPSVTTVYTVSGTSSLGCVSAPVPATVIAASLPTVTVNSGSICSGQSFTLLASGAVTYTYSSGQSVVSPTSTTSYTVTGNNAQGCVSQPAVALVTVQALPVISVNSGSICAGETFTLVPGGAASYTFSGGSPFVSPTITSNYSVSGTNSNGCVAQIPAVSTVVVNSLPVINVVSGTICPGGSFTLVPSGALTYTYSSGSPVVSPVMTSTYAVSGSGAGGCLSAAPAIATVQVQNALTITIPNGTLCAGESFTLNPSGANSYTYSGGSAIVTPSVTSTYSISGSSAGCVATSAAVVTITVYQLPLVTSNSGSVCSGQSFTLLPSGATSYSFSSGSAVVTPSATNVYTITGSDNLGCVSAPVLSTVNVNQSPIVSMAGGSICAGEAFTLAPAGALTYTYSSGSPVVSPVTTSTYNVAGTDANGCVSLPVIAEVTVHTINLTTSGPGFICLGESAELFAAGAVSYTWTAGNSPTVTGSGTLSVHPTESIYYYVAGLSTEGCQDSDTLLVLVDACVGLASQTAGAVHIFPNPTEGLFSVTIKREANLTIYNDIGQSVFEKRLSDGENAVDISHLARGLYFVFISDEGSSKSVRLLYY